MVKYKGTENELFSSLKAELCGYKTTGEISEGSLPGMLSDMFLRIENDCKGGE